ncbi:MAG TPA: methyltransferase domain-containing protein [Conexibacter sp.]|jgi:ubiquinone/menaquinone biosynthesis C-methylase UbiE|nr:methyltransferase domain-containing protein [Conexibacter sp.]
MTPDPDTTTDDPDELRAAVRERWERSADGWRRRNERFQAAAMPVSQWLVAAIEPQPGERVLELAAGVGETGFLAAELIAPGGGTLITSDGAEAMLVHARERAQQLGVTNVEFKPLELEWIDLAAASVDKAICRWGYMFALDKGAALRETRRVLRPGGRLALAAWTTPDHNPFTAIPRRTLVDAGLVDGFETSGPTMFDLADESKLRELLEDAGFAEIVIEQLPLTMPYDDVEDYIAATSDLSPAFADVVTPLTARQRDDLVERLTAATAPFAASDGSLAMPALALVAAASS